MTGTLTPALLGELILGYPGAFIGFVVGTVVVLPIVYGDSNRAPRLRAR